MDNISPSDIPELKKIIDRLRQLTVDPDLTPHPGVVDRIEEAIASLEMTIVVLESGRRDADQS